MCVASIPKPKTSPVSSAAFKMAGNGSYADGEHLAHVRTYPKPLVEPETAF
jgi:hypothetical protein